MSCTISNEGGELSGRHSRLLSIVFTRGVLFEARIQKLLTADQKVASRLVTGEGRRCDPLLVIMTPPGDPPNRWRHNSVSSRSMSPPIDDLSDTERTFAEGPIGVEQT